MDKNIRKQLRVEISFKWFDFWIGAFWNKSSENLYICLLPMLPIRIWMEKVYFCDECGAMMKKISYLDEGWDLSCARCGHTEVIEWPYGKMDMSGKDIENDEF